jgi:hypothetical protein
LARAQDVEHAPVTPSAVSTDVYGGESEVPPLQRLADRLPPAISDGLDVDGWIWLAGLQNNAEPSSHYFDAVFSLALTKSFDQRVAITAQGTFIHADGHNRAELEQGFVSMRVSDEMGTLFTIGKFNANFGVEPRDFWDRTTGTTSLLFNAQPQDLIGFMFTQPVGDTGVTLRPFMSADFQGGWDFNQPPSAGLQVEYEPSRELSFSLTNWVGPGLVLFGGEELNHPFPPGAYGDDGAAVVQNWQGPNLVAERASTLYFVNVSAKWRPRHDLTLAAEYLLGTTDDDTGQWGWHGWLVLADFAVTDRMHVWGRYSALDDSDWLITGLFHKLQEASCGVGYEIREGVEVRGEYRRDWSTVTPTFDSVSIHLTMAF